jgi:hypothetical protein
MSFIVANVEASTQQATNSVMAVGSPFFLRPARSAAQLILSSRNSVVHAAESCLPHSDSPGTHLLGSADFKLISPAIKNIEHLHALPIAEEFPCRFAFSHFLLQASSYLCLIR